MDFHWSAEQSAFRDAVVAFARRELADDQRTRDKQATFDRARWSACGAFGIQGLPFPEAYGGGGQDILTTVLAMEALGYGSRDNGLLFALAAQMWSVQMPIFRHGTDAQRARWLPALCSGALIGAHAMSEPGSGSDAFALQTTATRDGDHYVLRGAKTWVSEAPVADLFLVFATLDRSKGALGITGFLVEAGTPGLHVGQPIDKMGLRTSPMAELVLDEVRVPVENRLGREGRAVPIFNDSMEWERGLILASTIGSLERLLEESVAYCRQRRQYGQSIGAFQAIAHRLADIKVRLEAGRLLLYKAAWAKEHAQDAAMAAAIAKLYVSESLVTSCLHALQVRGGYGFTAEYEVERELRDAVGSTLYSGTSEIQRNLIARGLGLGMAELSA